VGFFNVFFFFFFFFFGWGFYCQPCCQAQQPAPLLQLFLRARGLLQDFLRLMEHMKIRTVLEDEREIVLELCVDLVSFHKLLIDSDLKSLLKVF
jgi:hypothetical protein